MKTEDIKIPSEIKNSDLKYPAWDSGNHVVDHFEMWFTERFGWCIPTLLISKAKRRSNVKDRTYGVTLEGSPVSMGKGPHVLKTITVYVTEKRKTELQKFLDLKTNGEAKAGEIRDRISTRRMQTTMSRAPLFMAWDS